jgi:hypothetical protein
MKTLNWILLMVIVIGVGLLVTQKYWVPGLVSFILEREGGEQQSENYEVVAEVPEVVEVPGSDMDTWNWVPSEVSAQGTQFSYPNPLPTTYVTPQNWPPTVELTAGAFVCEKGNVTGVDGMPKQYVQKTINGSNYCITTAVEGAAGSTYTSYEYTTAKGDFVTKVRFILRTPQCMNYDEPKQSACKIEQSTFDVDVLADRVASSARPL